MKHTTMIVHTTIGKYDHISDVHKSLMLLNSNLKYLHEDIPKNLTKKTNSGKDLEIFDMSLNSMRNRLKRAIYSIGVMRRTLPSLERRRMIRDKAISVVELTKGFPVNTTDETMKSLLEFTDYLLEFTNDLDVEPKE